MRLFLPPKRNLRALTSIEAVTLVAIVAILSVLVVTMGGNTTVGTARAKATHEIGTMAVACDAYKTDHGGYPQDNPTSGASVTNDLDARVAVNPTDVAYQSSSLFLYKQLTGDTNANGVIDAGETDPRYCTGFFRLSNFDREYRMTGVIAYIADPFGHSYGYSTAGLKVEQDLKARQEINPGAVRGASKGYNATFDLWSTGGATGNLGPADTDRTKWIKNW